MGLRARDPKPGSLVGVIAVLIGLGAAASPVGAADQIVLGKFFVVRDPAPGRDASLRSVVAVGSEGTSTANIVGDPVRSGATLEIIANGATPTDQLLTLPAGASVNGSAGWATIGNPVRGYRYGDSFGTNGPVKVALIERVERSFKIKLVLQGTLGPGPQPHILMVPPAPGTDGGILFTINGGDVYCVAFGGPARGTVENMPGSGPPNEAFKITSTAAQPTRRADCPSPLAGTRRPNIVVILTDDQRFDTVGSTHSLDGVTPVMPQVMDELADQGITFTNMYATTPLCTPSRTSILTGLYAHHTGVHSNYFIGAAIQSNALPTWLHAHGYRTGFFGKYPPQQNMVPVPPGWDEWQAFEVIGSFNYSLTNNGAPVSYGSTAPEYATDVLAGKVVQFIESTTQHQPFFCILATYAPHSEGFGFPQPAPRHVDTFAGIAPWRPPNYNEVALTGAPLWTEGLPLASDTLRSSGFLYGSWNDTFRERQLEALQAVDEAVASIVAAIEARAQSDDTAIIYTSDNGLGWGEHRIFFAKGPPYEESVRVPLVIRYPKLTHGPTVATQIALNIDLAATIADMAGLRPPYTLDGESLVPIIMDPVGAIGRADFLYESPHPTVYDSVGIRTRDEWEYNKYATGEDELYDLADDPNELESVTSDPARQTLKSTLAARIGQLQQ